MQLHRCDPGFAAGCFLAWGCGNKQQAIYRIHVALMPPPFGSALDRRAGATIECRAGIGERRLRCRLQSPAQPTRAAAHRLLKPAVRISSPRVASTRKASVDFFRRRKNGARGGQACVPRGCTRAENLHGRSSPSIVRLLKRPGSVIAGNGKVARSAVFFLAER